MATVRPGRMCSATWQCLPRSPALPAAPLKTDAEAQRAPRKRHRPPPVVPAERRKKSAAARLFPSGSAAQLSQGPLRLDGGGPDTPFFCRYAGARNFEQIAFYNEYNATLTGRGTKPRCVAGPPVGWRWFSATALPPSERAVTASIQRLRSARLAATVRSHSVFSRGKPTLCDRRRETNPSDALALRQPSAFPVSTAESLAALQRICPRYLLRRRRPMPGVRTPNTILLAVAVIRAENPPLCGWSCIHEELAQGA